MTRASIPFACLLCSIALTGCPIDLSDDNAGPTGSENLKPGTKVGDLVPSDLTVVCQRNLATLQSINSSSVECTVKAAFSTRDEAACTKARDACVMEMADDPAEKCQMLNGKIECSSTVQEVEDCIRELGTWAPSITCAMAGMPTAQPVCAKIFDTTCKALDDLYSAKAPPPVSTGGDDEDAGEVDPGETVDAGTTDGECAPGAQDSCACPGATTQGTTLCAPDRTWGSCQCGDDLPEPDAGIVGGGGEGCEGYDLGSGAACNECAVAACCDSYVACRADAECDCYWSCLELGGADCAFECALATEYPPLFLTHSLCLSDACGFECGL